MNIILNILKGSSVQVVPRGQEQGGQEPGQGARGLLEIDPRRARREGGRGAGEEAQGDEGREG